MVRLTPRKPGGHDKRTHAAENTESRERRPSNECQQLDYLSMEAIQDRGAAVDQRPFLIPIISSRGADAGLGIFH